MQFPLGIATHLRQSFDHIFIFGDDYIANQKRLYDHYGGFYPSFSKFKDVFNELVKCQINKKTQKEHRGLMAINNKYSGNSSNKTFQYILENNLSTFDEYKNNFVFLPMKENILNKPIQKIQNKMSKFNKEQLLQAKSMLEIMMIIGSMF